MFWSGLLRASRRATGLTKEAVALAATAGRTSASTAFKLYSSASAERVSGVAAAAAAAAVFAAGPVVFAGSDERSFIMIKPDGVQRGLMANIISRFESKGYKLIGIKVMVPSKELASRHYNEHDGRPFFPKLVDFLSSGAVIAMVWEGSDVVKFGRTMIGSTNPLASPPGTIRGDYGIDVGRNIIHGSDSVESAQREISLWFSPNELADYEITNGKWIYE